MQKLTASFIDRMEADFSHDWEYFNSLKKILDLLNKE